MKNIVKNIVIVVSILCLVGCGCIKYTARDAVINFFNQYTNLSVNVLSDLEKVVNTEDLTELQKEKYRNVLKRQYQDLKYNILKEEYDGNKVLVYLEIRVYDLKSAIDEANETLLNNGNDFVDDHGNYSVEKFMDYKLDLMGSVSNMKKYDITLELEKNESGKFIIKQLSDDTLKKIHGIYEEI